VLWVHCALVSTYRESACDKARSIETGHGRNIGISLFNHEENVFRWLTCAKPRLHKRSRTAQLRYELLMGNDPIYAHRICAFLGWLPVLLVASVAGQRIVLPSEPRMPGLWKGKLNGLRPIWRENRFGGFVVWKGCCKDCCSLVLRSTTSGEL